MSTRDSYAMGLGLGKQGGRGRLYSRLAGIVFQGRPDKVVRVQVLLLGLFLAGWCSYSFSLFDVAGRYSVTVVLLASALIATQSKMHVVFSLVMLAQVVSLLIGLSSASMVGTEQRPLTHGLQQCLAILVFMGCGSLKWREVFPIFIRLLVVCGLVVMAYGVYQVAARSLGLPYAFLPVTNLQEYVAEGAQRGSSRIGWTRASSVFAEPAQLGYFAVWLLAAALSIEGRLRVVLLICAGIGLVASQSLSCALGFVAVGVASALVNRKMFVLLASSGLLGVIFGLFSIVAPEAADPFWERIHQLSSGDMTADSNRISRTPSNLLVIESSPLYGHGLGSIDVVEPNGVAMGFLSVAIERGVLGAVFFFTPFLLLPLSLSFGRAKKDVFVQFSILIGWFHVVFWGATATLYFPPHWLALGIVYAASMNSSSARRRVRLSAFAGSPARATVLSTRNPPNETVGIKHQRLVKGDPNES